MCAKCNGKGYIDTGNNDLPCDCEAGDAAIFNTCDGQTTGKQLKERRERLQRASEDALIDGYLK